MSVDLDLLSWLGNLVNFLIFAFLSLNIVNTRCFGAFQMGLALIGLLVSITIQVISMIIRRNFKNVN